MYGRKEAGAERAGKSKGGQQQRAVKRSNYIQNTVAVALAPAEGGGGGGGFGPGP